MLILLWAGNICDDAVVLFLVAVNVESELHRQKEFQKVSEPLCSEFS